MARSIILTWSSWFCRAHDLSVVACAEADTGCGDEKLSQVATGMTLLQAQFGVKLAPQSGDIPPSRKIKRLKVMGSFNTGTNFVDRLLRVNLEAGLPETGFFDNASGIPTRYPPSCRGYLEGITLDAQEKFPVKNFAHQPLLCDDTWSGSGIHKHTLPVGLWVDKLMQEPNTVVVAMIRSPLALMQSLLKAPYSLATCLPRPLQSERTCSVSEAMGLLYDSHGVSTSKNFSSVAAILSAYIEGFEQWQRTAVAKVLVVTYEEAVLHPDVVVRRVFRALDLEQYMPSPIINFNEPAKPHGLANGRATAKQKIVTRSYLNSSSVEESAYLKASCEHFDPNLLRQFTIPTVPNRTYDSDCLTT